VNNWKIIWATMVIFGAGVVTGGLLVKHASRVPPGRAHRPPAVQRPAPAVSPGGMRLEFLRRAERELDLTRGQRERADQIIKDSQERTKKILEPVAPEMRNELQRTREEFRGVLTPAQRARFDEMAKQPKPQREPRRSPPASNSVPASP
jgi:hypothetical protein